jgi:hypothetical protein
MLLLQRQTGFPGPLALGREGNKKDSLKIQVLKPGPGLEPMQFAYKTPNPTKLRTFIELVYICLTMLQRIAKNRV